MKTGADMQSEKKRINVELERCTSRQNSVNTLYEKLYDDNASAKVWLLNISRHNKKEQGENCSIHKLNTRKKYKKNRVFIT